MEPQIAFCQSADGTRIAYTTLGDGSGTPVVSVNSWLWTIDMIMEHQAQRAQLESLTGGRRVVTFDRRGMGASERDPIDFSLEANIADLSTLVERLEASRVHLVGYGDGTAIAAAYAAQNPERVARMVLFFPLARGTRQPESTVRLIRENWSWARRLLASHSYPHGPVELQRWISSALRRSMSPEAAVKMVEATAAIDITESLGRVQAPTLVVTVRRDPSGGQVAALIPGARLLFLSGDDPAVPSATDERTHAITEFIDGTRPTGETLEPVATVSPQSGTATILFADMVDSTALTEQLGDTAFREKARDLDTVLRSVIRDHDGTCIDAKTLGDGVLATFTSAKQAVEAALACGRAGDEMGLPLHLGLHAGDVIREDGNVFGGAVNIAARISGLSAPGELLVSGTVRELARTSSGVSFEDRGEQALKGVGEAVRVFRVVRSFDSPSADAAGGSG